MRHFAKEEKKMRDFAGSGKITAKGKKHGGRKIKVTHHAAAGKRKPKIARHKYYQKKA